LQAFNYYAPATGQHFIGRQEETEALANLLKNGEHAVIYDAPKTGKTSLILHTLGTLKNGNFQFRTTSASFLNTRTLDEMTRELGEAALKTVCKTSNEYSDMIERYLSDSGFRFDAKAYAESGTILSFAEGISIKQFLRVFSLPFVIAAELGERIIFTIDYFQNIMYAEEGPDCCRAMGEILRDSEKGSCTYIIVGSWLNAMKDIFEFHNWFNHSVKRVELQTIASNLIIDHSAKEFLTWGKVVEKELMLGMCRLFRCNMWYINTFCATCDYLSRGYIMEPVLEEGLKCILASHEYRFNETMSNLTSFQVNLLKAIIEGKTKFSASETIREYGLNSSANVRRLKEALSKKEIVYFDENDFPNIIDPLFEYWLQNFYFKIK